MRNALGAVAAAALATSVACRRPEVPASTPAGLDVVVVTVDTWRADAAGFAGHPRLKTPAFDRFASRGRVYTDARAHNVVTLPSHANILTGLLPFEHGLRDNVGARLPAASPTLATRLKERGYATGAFVSAYPLDARWGLGRGFDVYDDRYGKGTDTGSFQFPERPGSQTVAAALDWWRRQPPGRRFLWVHVFEPHAPYRPAPPFDTEYRDAPYLGEVATADAALEPLLLEVLSGAPGSVLAFLTGDHGEALGEHGEATHGLFAYDATLRVPLVAVGPRLPGGRDGRPAGHVDIVPTVLDALGSPPDPRLSGRSLAAGDAAGRVLYFEALSASLNRGWAPLTGVLSSGLKYVDLPIRELYDLREDPAETRNLAQARDEDLRSLARRLPPEAKEPPRRETPSSEEIAKLRALGYVASASAPPARRSYTEADDPKRLVEVDQSIDRSIAFYQQGLLDQAIGEAQRLLARHPRLSVGVEHLAFLYQQAGRLPEAARLLEAFLSRSGNAGEVTEPLRARYGMVLSEMGRANEAVPALRPLAASTSPDSLNALGIALADSGDPAGARQVFARSLSFDPENARALESLGVVALREGKLQEARDSYRRALAVNPRLPAALNGLAVAELQLGNLSGALDAWRTALGVNPGDLQALLNMGISAARGGRPDVAVPALRRFLEVAPPERFARERAEVTALLGSLPALPPR